MLQFATVIILGIIYHEGKQIGICQTVLLRKSAYQVLPQLTLGIEFDANIVPILVREENAVRELTDSY